MPNKKLTDQDRLLAFAFRASIPELEEARAVLDAALRAKKGGGTPRKPRVPKTTATPKPADNQKDS